MRKQGKTVDRLRPCRLTWPSRSEGAPDCFDFLFGELPQSGKKAERQSAQSCFIWGNQRLKAGSVPQKI